MRNVWILVLAAILLGMTGSFALAGQSDVGAFQNAKGQVWIVRDGETLTAQSGTSVRENDLLRTGADGSAGVVLEDSTQFSMGPDTEIVITHFLFNPREGKLGLGTQMLKGTTNYQSGTIGKLAPESVKFKTPQATLGIRGTHFLVKVDLQ